MAIISKRWSYCINSLSLNSSLYCSMRLREDKRFGQCYLYEEQCSIAVNLSLSVLKRNFTRIYTINVRKTICTWNHVSIHLIRCNNSNVNFWSLLIFRHRTTPLLFLQCTFIIELIYQLKQNFEAPSFFNPIVCLRIQSSLASLLNLSRVWRLF